MLILWTFPFRASAEDFTNVIHAYLRQRVEIEKKDVGIVVGLVDEHGSSIVSCGKMDSTRITLTPELKARFAQGHNASGHAVPSWDVPILSGAGAFRSTANDLLKFVSANLGLTPSSLTPLMEKTHVPYFHESSDTDTGLAWEISRNQDGTRIVWKTGGTAGCRTFVGLNKARRRGVVILSNSQDFDLVYGLGNVLLESDWQANRLRKASDISKAVDVSGAGLHQRSPDIAWRSRLLRQIFGEAPEAPILVSAGICLALMMFLLWRAAKSRKR